jgi:hypothetical protein
MRYHTFTNHFIVVTGGKIRVKMTPWKSSRFLEPVKDYDAYEFRSPINVWNPADEHKSEMDKLRFLDFEVHSGYVLSVPPYWWYSIRFSTDPGTCVCTATYDTIVNALAQSYDWSLFYLQQSNITRKVSRTYNGNADEVVSSPIEIPSTETNPSNDSSPPVDSATAVEDLPKEPEKRDIVTNAGIYHID